MVNPSSIRSDALDRFDAWLHAQNTMPPADFLLRTRQRLQRTAQADPLDQLIDDCLRPDPALPRASLLPAVRQKLATNAHNHSHNSTPRWFPILTPLAAAATLTFALLSFNSTPQSSAPPPTVTLDTAEPLATDSTIFALAHSLQGLDDVQLLDIDPNAIAALIQ